MNSHVLAKQADKHLFYLVKARKEDNKETMKKEIRELKKIIKDPRLKQKQMIINYISIVERRL